LLATNLTREFSQAKSELLSGKRGRSTILPGDPSLLDALSELLLLSLIHI